MATRPYGRSATSATARRRSGSRLRSPRRALRERVDVDVEDVAPPVGGDGLGHLQPVVGSRGLQHGTPDRALGRTVGSHAAGTRASTRGRVGDHRVSIRTPLERAWCPVGPGRAKRWFGTVAGMTTTAATSKQPGAFRLPGYTVAVGPFTHVAAERDRLAALQLAPLRRPPARRDGGGGDHRRRPHGARCPTTSWPSCARRCTTTRSSSSATSRWTRTSTWRSRGASATWRSTRSCRRTPASPSWSASRRRRR